MKIFLDPAVGLRYMAKKTVDAVGGAGNHVSKTHVPANLPKFPEISPKNPTQDQVHKYIRKAETAAAEIVAERAKPRVERLRCASIPIGNGNFIVDGRYFSLDLLVAIAKKAGIRRVIDTISKKNDFVTNGIEFSHVNMRATGYGLGFLGEPPFIDARSFLERQVLGMPLSEANKYRKAHRAESNARYKELTSDYIERFLKFIQNMQKGNCIVKSTFHDVDFGILLQLNKLFNPHAETISDFVVVPLSSGDRVISLPSHLANYRAYAFKSLYKNLTQADKQRIMGWTPEFEKTVTRILDEDEKLDIRSTDLLKSKYHMNL